MQQIINAPFTLEQIEKLNEYQTKGMFHPFTCCSPGDIPECLRACKKVDGQIIKGSSDGVLIATTKGWVCPCGKYTQDWAYNFMTKGADWVNEEDGMRFMSGKQI